VPRARVFCLAFCFKLPPTTHRVTAWQPVAAPSKLLVGQWAFDPRPVQPLTEEDYLLRAVVEELMANRADRIRLSHPGLRSRNLSTLLKCRRASFFSPSGLGVILSHIVPAEPWDPAAQFLPDIRHHLDPLGCSAPIWKEPIVWVRCKNLQLFEPSRKHFFQP
jgi:hypothetical protein